MTEMFPENSEVWPEMIPNEDEDNHDYGDFFLQDPEFEQDVK
jgi:hypothetical protein